MSPFYGIERNEGDERSKRLYQGESFTLVTDEVNGTKISALPISGNHLVITISGGSHDAIRLTLPDKEGITVGKKGVVWK